MRCGPRPSGRVLDDYLSQALFALAVQDRRRRYVDRVRRQPRTHPFGSHDRALALSLADHDYVTRRTTEDLANLDLIRYLKRFLTRASQLFVCFVYSGPTNQLGSL